MNPPASRIPCLYRLRLSAGAPSEGVPGWDVRHPAPGRFAVEARDLAAPPSPQAMQGADFEIVAVPPELREDPVWKDALSAWLMAGSPAAICQTAFSHLQALWVPGRAVVSGPAAALPPAAEAIAEFLHGERILSGLEQRLSAGWGAAEADMPLAYDVTPADKHRFEDVGRHMRTVMQVRLEFARLEPLLARAAGHLAPSAQGLGARLREDARWEERAEILDGQVETQEGIYELASQRIGEYRHARQGFVLEVAIIAILAAETLLILWEILFRQG